MLNGVPQGDQVEAAGKSLQPEGIVDPLPAQLQPVFLQCKLAEHLLRLNAMGGAPRIAQECAKLPCPGADIKTDPPPWIELLTDESEIPLKLDAIPRQLLFDVGSRLVGEARLGAVFGIFVAGVDEMKVAGGADKQAHPFELMAGCSAFGAAQLAEDRFGHGLLS